MGHYGAILAPNAPKLSGFTGSHPLQHIEDLAFVVSHAHQRRRR
jgi:hypothetical protein